MPARTKAKLQGAHFDQCDKQNEHAHEREEERQRERQVMDGLTWIANTYSDRIGSAFCPALARRDARGACSSGRGPNVEPYQFFILRNAALDRVSKHKEFK